MNITSSDVTRVVTDVCGQALWLNPIPVDPVGHAAGFDGQLAAVVRIDGPWQGAIAIQCTSDLASRAAGAMFDKNPASINRQDEFDALGEMVNMIGGNLKPLVPGPSCLSLPSVVAADNLAASLAGCRQVSRQWFDCEGQPLVVAVFQNGSPTRGGGRRIESDMSH